MIKGLTIHQPYASLIAEGEKRYETRGYNTNYRGLIAICAGKKSFRSVFREMFPWAWWEYHPDSKYAREWLADVCGKCGISVPETADITLLVDRLGQSIPYGAIVAVAELKDVWKVVQHSKDHRYYLRSVNKRPSHYTYTSPDYDYREISEEEKMFGDYSEGRYAWELANIQKLPEPVPIRGQQSLWNVPPEIEELLYENRASVSAPDKRYA
jgi:hypothetical protein